MSPLPSGSPASVSAAGESRRETPAAAGSRLPIKSMTGFAQVRHAFDAAIGFVLSLKSVNHRYLDVQLRLPGDSDGLEMKLRRALKEKLTRGHVELTLNVDRGGAGTTEINREVVGGFIRAFRQAADEFGIASEPDLNAILRMPGALTAASNLPDNDRFDESVLQQLDIAIQQLDRMRAREGDELAADLRGRMKRLAAATSEVETLREQVSRLGYEKLRSRLAEFAANCVEPERVAQEAAVLAERSDIQEEVVRLRAHIDHFLELLEGGGELGKKLDFLLQELNREANTMLSKTAGLAGGGVRITELGLEMKSEIEKSREQVQNLE